MYSIWVPIGAFLVDVLLGIIWGICYSYYLKKHKNKEDSSIENTQNTNILKI